MDIIISNTNGVPIYEQIKEQLKNKILNNELKSGELLPSIRVLAKDLKCSVITTKNAYTTLENEGFIKSIPSKGFYVANINKELILEEQFKKIESLLENVVSISKNNNITKKNIIEILNILYEEEK